MTSNDKGYGKKSTLTGGVLFSHFSTIETFAVEDFIEAFAIEAKLLRQSHKAESKALAPIEHQPSLHDPQMDRLAA